MENMDAQLATIKPGMPVYGIDGESLGTVEAVEGDNLRLLNHVVPTVAVKRVDESGVQLHIARAAFTAAAPETSGMASSGEA